MLSFVRGRHRFTSSLVIFSFSPSFFYLYRLDSFRFYFAAFTYITLHLSTTHSPFSVSIENEKRKNKTVQKQQLKKKYRNAKSYKKNIYISFSLSFSLSVSCFCRSFRRTYCNSQHRKNELYARWEFYQRKINRTRETKNNTQIRCIRHTQSTFRTESFSVFNKIYFDFFFFFSVVFRLSLVHLHDLMHFN